MLNFWIRQIRLIGTADPDQALSPLAKLFPQEQIGYSHLGGTDAYSEPWTATFENLTVRQFANRIAEHTGARTAWIWDGGKDGRVFYFSRGGHETRPLTSQAVTTRGFGYGAAGHRRRYVILEVPTWMLRVVN